MKTMILLCWMAPAVWAQFDLGGAKTHESGHPHSAMIDASFIHYDGAIGLTYRYSISGPKFLGIFGTFYARPYAKAVLVKAGPKFYFQLQEYRNILAAGIDKKIWINSRLDGFLAGGVGVAIVDYRGTGEGVFLGHKIEKKQGLVPLVRLGLSYKVNRHFFIRGGYQYFDAKTADGHRVYVGVGGQL